MASSASPKTLVSGCKKIVLMMILVFSGVCLWSAQALLCHHCNESEICTKPQNCTEDQQVCYSRIHKMPSFISVRKDCFTTCEDLSQEESLGTTNKEKFDDPDTTNNMTNKKNIMLRQKTFMEYDITCCDFDLCNQARVRGPGDTILIFGLLLNSMWLICCSVL